MKLTIKGNALRANRTFRRSIANHVQFAFSRFAEFIVSAKVTLEFDDGNGGRAACTCSVNLEIAPAGSAAVEAVGDTAEQALSDALSRMQRLLSLRLCDARQI